MCIYLYQCSFKIIQDIPSPMDFYEYIISVRYVSLLNIIDRVKTFPNLITFCTQKPMKPNHALNQIRPISLN
jgi:hypothetical protein